MSVHETDPMQFIVHKEIDVSIPELEWDIIRVPCNLRSCAAACPSDQLCTGLFLPCAPEVTVFVLVTMEVALGTGVLHVFALCACTYLEGAPCCEQKNQRVHWSSLVMNAYGVTVMSITIIFQACALSPKYQKHTQRINNCCKA